ncbi:MAG TPA: aspartate aminotransferase family protein [Verrucomicrobiae bacterium]|nr:aspartate aminotransferase family protein [Verrucomicrobiae bacterium]
MTVMQKSFSANSLEQHWAPFTSNREFKSEPRLITKAEGMYYWNHRGEKLIDGSAGLFCAAAGHCRKEITEAVSKQLATLDFASPFQSGHPLSFELARRVAQITPGDLNYVFFTNSGSESVDTAMKIALAYQRARGEGTRTRFVSRERAYHGVNLGGVALSGLVRNREAFAIGVANVVHMRHTWLPENKFVKGQPETGADLANDLQRFVDLYGASTLAACFVEPIAGSTGVLIPPKGYLERLREICDKHGILLVFDEVICGFGRTGKAFAADSFGVLPDILTMAKGLTNGAQPMGAVACSTKVYDTIVDAAPDGAIELFHGYTYSGHPAACAAGLATLDIYEREGLFERAAELSEYFLDSVFALSDLPIVTDIRGYGLLAGIDLAPMDGKPGLRGLDCTKRLFNSGMHIKFTGDAGIIAPPLIADKKHVDEICAIFRKTLGQY